MRLKYSTFRSYAIDSFVDGDFKIGFSWYLDCLKISNKVSWYKGLNHNGQIVAWWDEEA